MYVPFFQYPYPLVYRINDTRIQRVFPAAARAEDISAGYATVCSLLLNTLIRWYTEETIPAETGITRSSRSWAGKISACVCHCTFPTLNTLTCWYTAHTIPGKHGYSQSLLTYQRFVLSIEFELLQDLPQVWTRHLESLCGGFAICSEFRDTASPLRFKCSLGG